MKKLSIRKFLIAIVSTLIFIALVVVALIIARGNVLTTQGILATGSIRFNVTPSGNYEIFLNEQSQKISNNSIASIAPGNYELKITKTGYTDWQQSIDVRAGFVTDITVQLFPAELQLEQLSKTNIDKVFFSHSHRYVYYSITNYPLGTSVGIWKETLQQSNIPLIEERPLKITNLTSTIENAVLSGKFEVKPSLDDGRILLITDTDIYILDATRYNEPDATTLLDISYPIDEIEWFRGSSNLVIRSGNLLIDYDLNTKASTIITYQLEKSPTFTITMESVIYLLDNVLYKYAPGNNARIELENVTLPTGISKLVSGSLSDKNLVLQADSVLYYLNVSESYLTQVGTYNLLSLSPSGRSLIVSSGETIESVEINISLVENTVETVKRATGLIGDINSDSIIWDEQSNYFVFQNKGELDRIYSADFAGNNINLLLFSASITTPAQFGIPANNSGLIVKLLDSQEQSSAGEVRANLYHLGFSQ
jgi:hypothetical protein